VSQRHPVAKRARLGLDTKTTEIVAVPRIKVMTVGGVKGVWVPLHPLTELRKG